MMTNAGMIGIVLLVTLSPVMSQFETAGNPGFLGFPAPAFIPGHQFVGLTQFPAGDNLLFCVLILSTHKKKS